MRGVVLGLGVGEPSAGECVVAARIAAGVGQLSSGALLMGAAPVEPLWWDDVVEPTLDQLREAAEVMSADELEWGGVARVEAARAEAARADRSDQSKLAGWVRREWDSDVVGADVRALMHLAPGPELVAALVRLGSREVCPVDHGPTVAEVGPCACQVIIVAGWQAVAGWLGVKAAEAVVDAAGATPRVFVPQEVPAGRVVDVSREELAAVLHLSPLSVAARICAARDLTAFPEWAALIADGVVSAGVGQVVMTETARLSEGARAEVIDRMVSKARARKDADRAVWTPGTARRAVRAVVLAVAGDEQADARGAAYQERRVTVSPGTDGMAWLNAYLPEIEARRIHARLTAAAAAVKADDPDDARSADQRRADLLIGLLLATHVGTLPDCAQGGMGDANATHVCPDHAGKTEVSVVVSMDTLLGISEACGVVDGVGPVDADIARELAADGRWRLWVADGAGGNVVATGSRSYTPSASLSRLIRAREVSCRMPGCARRSVDCDLDHTVPYPAAPGTVAENLGPLCRVHHNMKTHHGFQLENLSGPQTAWRWTFPSGLTHTGSADPPLLEA